MLSLRSILLVLAAVEGLVPLSAAFQCSASSPCAVGCCGKNGRCGFGPEFCAPANCTSSCDQKASCDPGWGSEWSKAETCSKGCCLKDGLCGFTAKECGPQQGVLARSNETVSEIKAVSGSSSSSSYTDDNCSVDYSFLENDETDSDGDHLEVQTWDDDCYAIPNYDDPDITTRSLDKWVASPHRVRAEPAGGYNDGHAKICNADGECFAVLDEEDDPEFLNLRAIVLAAAAAKDKAGEASEADLDKRARREKICLSKSKSAYFRAKSYPRASILSARNVAVFAVNTASCVSSGLDRATFEAGKFVVEHVMELQETAMMANSMLSGQLPTGGHAPGYLEKYVWMQMFAPTGYIFQGWQYLGGSAPSGYPGVSPEDSLMRAMGSTSDIRNLLVLGAVTNGIKARAFQGFVNIFSVRSWTRMSQRKRVQMLLQIYGVVEYMNTEDAQAALGAGFNAMLAIYGHIDTLAQSNSEIETLTGVTYADAVTAFVDSHFTFMTSNLIRFVTSKIFPMLEYWRESNADDAKEIHETLVAMYIYMSNRLAINKGFMGKR